MGLLDFLILAMCAIALWWTSRGKTAEIAGCILLAVLILVRIFDVSG